MKIRAVWMLLFLLISSPSSAQGPASNSAFGKALVLNGVDAYAWMTPNVSGAGQGTVELWVLADALPSSYQIWGGGNGEPGVGGDWLRLGGHSEAPGFSMGLYITAPFSWKWAGNGPLVTDRWTHVAATWGPGGIRLYIDGELAGTNAYSGAVHSFATELIGASAYGSYFDGIVDDVRIWNYVRSPSDIQATMDAPLGSDVYGNASSGLIAYYRFESLEDLGVGGDGADDIRDDSVSANHADTDGAVTLGTGAVAVEGVSWSDLKSAYDR